MLHLIDETLDQVDALVTQMQIHLSESSTRDSISHARHRFKVPHKRTQDPGTALRLHQQNIQGLQIIRTRSHRPFQEDPAPLFKGLDGREVRRYPREVIRGSPGNQRAYIDHSSSEWRTRSSDPGYRSHPHQNTRTSLLTRYQARR